MRDILLILTASENGITDKVGDDFVVRHENTGDYEYVYEARVLMTFREIVAAAKKKLAWYMQNRPEALEG